MNKLNDNNKTSGIKLWFMVWSLGLAGQICWNIENQWFNTFVYAKIGKDPTIITGMLIASAAATTFSTFFFGTWSDRIGKRRHFISLGYILWGVFTIVFGLTQFISPAMYAFAGVMVVLADTVMSFFGSMGNDAAFNAWINDIMDDNNRGQMGAALATQPVLGTILGTVVGGFLVGSDDRYMRLFLVMGLLVISFGILSFFMMSKSDDVAPSKRGAFWEQFFSVFNIRKLLRLRELLCVNLSVCIFFIGFNAYFAYMGNYIIYYLGFTADQMGIIEAVPLVLAMLSAIPVSRFINRGRNLDIAVLGCALNAAGLAVLSTVRPADINTASLFNPVLFFGILLVGIGYISFLQTTKIWAKQLYPEESRGQFEGIWILFFVLFPMIGGSLLGQFAVKHSGKTFVDVVSGQTQYIPDSSIFIYGLVFILIAIIPLVLTKKTKT
jgi:MFS family permease